MMERHKPWPRRFGSLAWILQKTNRFSVDHISPLRKSARHTFGYCEDPSRNLDTPADNIFQLVDDGNVPELDRLLGICPALVNIKDDFGKTLLHHAAEHGHTVAVDVLAQRGSEVLATDLAGNTPLHLAAMRDKPATVEALIALREKGGNSGFCLRNLMLETPMHIAVRNGAVASLEVLLNACDGKVNSPGWHGDTPLHVSCCTNRLECTRILIAYGADPLAGSFSGMKPIHSAARRAANETLKFLLSSSGIDKNILLNLVDDENNTPLHWAVNNGNLETVKILIDNGAALDSQTYDKSTPLHLACSQGLLGLVTLMQETVPAQFYQILCQKDTQGMTCLHRATMFNHVNVCEFLLKKGIDINEEDNEGRTALILSSSRESWDAQSLLLRHGADPNRHDQHGRNFLHYLIQKGCSPDICSETMKSVQSCHALMDQKDCDGCTPLHLAAQNGSLRSSSGLVRMGASVSAKDSQMQSPLHFAAHYGRYNTVKRLLESDCGVNIINDSDNHGLTALHLAAQNGHDKVVQLLMTKGALIHRDYLGRTPLHLAAAADYYETIDVIVIHYAHLIDSFDKEGNTALHLAASTNAERAVTYLLTAGASLLVNQVYQRASDIAIQRKHHESMLAMVSHKRWEEILLQKSALYGWPILGLIEHLPEVMTAVLDRCILRAPCHPLSKDYFIHFDFKLLEPKEQLNMTDGEPNLSESLTDPDEPLLALNYMVRHKRCKLLCHPVCSSFMNKKWARYGIYFHGLNMTMYSIFLALLTYLICTEVQDSLIPRLKRESVRHLQYYQADLLNSSLMQNWMESGSERSHKPCPMVTVLIIYAGVGMVREVFQFVQQKLKYLTGSVNYLEWLLYVSVTIFALGTLDEHEQYVSWELRWQMGAVAVFVGWFVFMLYMQRFGMIGIYVVMFLGILKTLLKAPFVFIFLIVGFSLAFHVLMPLLIYPENAEFYMKSGFSIDLEALRTPHLGMWTSMLRITSMLIGDLDMIHNYINPMTERTMPFPVLTYVFLVMFVITVSILLMNLLIGLAVGDIGNVQREAALRRMAMQVEQHTGLERKLPRWVVKRVAIYEDKYYPNRPAGLLRKLWFIAQDPAEAMKEQGEVRQGVMDNYQIGTELCKHRKKMKELQGNISQLHDMLRLVVQKMEINEEADELDEVAKTVSRKLRKDSVTAVKRARWATSSSTRTKASMASYHGSQQHEH